MNWIPTLMFLMRMSGQIDKIGRYLSILTLILVSVISRCEPVDGMRSDVSQLWGDFV